MSNQQTAPTPPSDATNPYPWPPWEGYRLSNISRVERDYFYGPLSDRAAEVIRNAHQKKRQANRSYVEKRVRAYDDNTKMDPFEVRVRFTQHLQHLNASVTASNKAAQYALKYREMDEDLHSCILEQLSGNTMNNRANIMYFIEHLCDMAERENHMAYVRMMTRDILKIVDSVAPEDGSGAANVKVVRKVLQALGAKSFLMQQTISEIEDLLRERDTGTDDVGDSPSHQDTEMGGIVNGTPKVQKTNGAPKVDKRQIEQRIEEDRERHKRLREEIWAVPKGGKDAEFEKLWEETSELGEDDWDLNQEEIAENEEKAQEWKEAYLAAA